MRPLLAALVGGTILGIIQLYLVFQASVPMASPPPEVVLATGRFQLDVTLSFAAEADAFSVLPGESPIALEVRRQGEILLRRETPVAAGEVLVVDDLQGITAGTNEFLVRAFPKDEGFATTGPRALRVRVLRDGQPLGTVTIWSEPGTAVEGPVRIEVPELESEPEHRHGSADD